MRTTLTFARAFDVIIHNQNTTPAEKLVLIEVCRYYPNIYYGTNEQISHNTCIDKRRVQRILKALSTGPTKREGQKLKPRRAYIDRGYAHRTIDGKLYTQRVIVPLFLPKCRHPG
jgi:hypothetical protein